MQDRPTSAEILEVARETLLANLLPELHGARRLDGLMIANALAIVGRALARGEAPADAARTRLEALFGEAPLAAGNPEENRRRLERRLAVGVRAGAFDAPGPGRDAVRRHIRESTLDKLRESNPKHLAAAGLE